MFFDLQYIRRFLGVAIKILLVVGLIIIIFGIIFTVIIDVEDDSKFAAVRMVNGLKYINQSLFMFGVTLIVCGLIGYLTTKINNDLTVGLFALTSLIIFATFLIFAIGFVALFVVNQTVQNTNDACIKSDFFQVSERLFQKASRYYGSNKCKTNIKDIDPFMKNPNFTKKDIKVDKKNGYSNVIDCPNYEDMLNDLSDYPNYIGSLELTLQCSGICNPHPIYVFSDVNRGPPKEKQACFPVLLDYIDKIGVPFMAVIWFITCLLLLVVIYSICLFFHPKRYDDLYIYTSLKNQDDENLEQNQANKSADINHRASSLQKPKLSRQYTTENMTDPFQFTQKRKDETDNESDSSSSKDLNSEQKDNKQPSNV